MAVLSVVSLSVALFVATNVDDLFVLAAFYADGRSRVRDVVLGQFAGIAALSIGSLALSLAAVAFSTRWVGFLGVLPAAVGARMAWYGFRGRPQGEALPAVTRGVGVLSVAAVTIANGTDNVAAYVAFFASRTLWECAAASAIFATMTAVWCLAAHRLVHHPTLGRPLRRYGGTVLPFVLVALGVHVFVAAGATEIVARAFDP